MQYKNPKRNFPPSNEILVTPNQVLKLNHTLENEIDFCLLLVLKAIQYLLVLQDFFTAIFFYFCRRRRGCLVSPRRFIHPLVMECIAEVEGLRGVLINV
ncbi:hypothetical protein CEXT_474251 [Caerostris extrusa]|uniref:Uncharacterized protein n=1 Tax=Caerostris extrusa TaxID=172846 RepID=A0AAV4Y4S3_CAEEX|nr:hypothetical protein CEXT_474251 [Caerostris extrusa]